SEEGPAVASRPPAAQKWEELLKKGAKDCPGPHEPEAPARDGTTLAGASGLYERSFTFLAAQDAAEKVPGLLQEAAPVLAEPRRQIGRVLPEEAHHPLRLALVDADLLHHLLYPRGIPAEQLRHAARMLLEAPADLLGDVLTETELLGQSLDEFFHRCLPPDVIEPRWRWDLRAAQRQK